MVKIKQTWYKKGIIGILIAGLAALLIAACVILKPFLMPIVWAFVFTLIFFSVHQHFQKRFAKKGLATGLFTLLILLVGLGVVSVVVSSAVSEVAQAATQMQKNNHGTLLSAKQLKSIPYVGNELSEKWQHFADNPEKLKATREMFRYSQLPKQLWHFVANMPAAFLSFVIGVVMFYFFLKEGQRLSGSIKKGLDKVDKGIYPTIVEGTQCVPAIGATFASVGLVTGVLMGIVYSLCGLPAPIVLAGVTAMATVVPFASPIVYILIFLALGLSGMWLEAIIILATGFTLSGLLENVLQPLVVSKIAKLHFLVVFLGILGGLACFGMVGIFLGPLVLNLLLKFSEWSSSRLAA